MQAAAAAAEAAPAPTGETEVARETEARESESTPWTPESWYVWLSTAQAWEGGMPPLDQLRALPAARQLWLAAGGALPDNAHRGSLHMCRHLLAQDPSLATAYWARSARSTHSLVKNDWERTTPLHAAAYKQLVGVVRYLVEEVGVPADGPPTADGMNPPLWYAVLGHDGDDACVRYLAERAGADVDRHLASRHLSNSTPLRLAIKCARLDGRRASLDVARYLLRRGARLAPREDFVFVDDYGERRYLHAQLAELRAWASAPLAAHRTFCASALFGMHPLGGAGPLASLQHEPGLRELVAEFCGVPRGADLRNWRVVDGWLTDAAEELRFKSQAPERTLGDEPWLDVAWESDSDTDDN